MRSEIPAASLVLLACLAPAAPSHAAAPTRAVVLADGTVLAARTRPVIALGQVSFVGAHGGLVTLDVRRIDVSATRALAGAAADRPAPRVWNARSLEALTGRVQYATDGGDMPPPRASATPRAESASAADEDAEQVALLRERISTLERRLGDLAADDPQREPLARQVRVLQDEVRRLSVTPRLPPAPS